MKIFKVPDGRDLLLIISYGMVVVMFNEPSDDKILSRGSSEKPTRSKRERRINLELAQTIKIDITQHIHTLHCQRVLRFPSRESATTRENPF